ncbi:MAG: methyltransferase domain-containing protein [Myxococcota bacterium]
MTAATPEDAVVDTTRAYYDSDPADRFYSHVWGGEDIHVGIYEAPSEAIRVASRRTVETMAGLVPLSEGLRVLDLGAGYGGAARHLALSHGCHVTCLNLSQTQNARNRAMNARASLSSRIEVVGGNFESLPFEDGAFDLLWSQDAILHSARRRRVLEEAFRVLRPGGRFVFTDPMQADDCPPGVLGPVLARIHLASLGSFEFYVSCAKEIGFEVVKVVDLGEQLPRHYRRVREELEGRYDELSALSGQDYVDRMLTGLGHWVEAGTAGHLAWGILHLRKP